MGNGFLLVIFALLALITSASYVSVTSSGYQDVVVKIDDDVGDCETVIEDIKVLIQNVSATWSEALDSPLYFGNVTIVVPGSCKAFVTSNGSQLSWVRLHKADFVITPNHPVFGMTPYSFQYGECGDPGLPINVPWSANLTDESQGKRLVREWAHYRYGVFDEGGQLEDDRHPSAFMAYQTQGNGQRSVANTCSEKKTPRGHWNEKTCQTTANASCEFIPDKQNPEIFSSLMYRPDLSHMWKFCDETNHDALMPSKLNYYCDGKSASSVIKRHRDYKTPYIGSANTTTFSVITNPFRGYHIILDVGSFEERTFSYARKSLLQFIGHLPDGIVLSIDFFNSNFTIFQEPVVLNEDIRSDIITNLSDITSSRVNNYQGLTKALDNGLLMAQNGQDIIMITMLPAKLSTSNFSDYVSRYQANKVNLHLMYYPPTVSKELVQLADLAVNGSFHFVPNAETAIDGWLNALSWSVGTLQTIFSETFSYRAKIFELSMTRTASNDTEKSGTFYVDSSASKLRGCLYFIDTSSSSLYVDKFTLYKPNGQAIDVADDRHSDGMYLFLVKTTSDLEPGVWRYDFTLDKGSPRGTLRLDIWADPADKTSSIELHTWNTAIDQKPWDAASRPIGIYAQLTQNRKPIQGANVTAHVYAIADRSTSSSVRIATIQLRDEGPTDVTTGDGIYSGWMTSISNATLSYAVKFEVKTSNQAALVDNGSFNRPPTTGSVITMTQPVPAADQFQRYHYGPGFQLTPSTSNNVDYIPPARITDLAIASYSQSSRELVLTWTAPRDNFGDGSLVNRFTLIMTSNTETQETTFTRNSLDESGRLNYSIIVPSSESSISYRVYGIDANNNKGKASNVVSIMEPLPPAGLSATAWGLIGASIALVVILFIVFLICYFCPDKARARKRQAAKTVRQIFEMPAKKSGSNRKESDDNHETHNWRTVETSGIQTAAKPSSTTSRTSSVQGSERVYFSQRDIDEMTSGARSDTGSYTREYERGTEEVIKRAPSMNLQLAAILEMNSSNLSLDKAGVSQPQQQQQQQKQNPKPEVIIQPKIYKTRPVSHQPYGSLTNSVSNNRPLSTSETSLYQQSDVVQMRRNVTGSSVSSPSNSYLSVFAEPRVERAQPQQPVNTSRPDLRNDDVPFSYTDARFSGQPRGHSSFDPLNHPANQVGVPLNPRVPQGFQRDSVSSSQSDRSAAKPKRVSAV